MDAILVTLLNRVAIATWVFATTIIGLLYMAIERYNINPNYVQSGLVVLTVLNTVWVRTYKVDMYKHIARAMCHSSWYYKNDLTYNLQLAVWFGLVGLLGGSFGMIAFTIVVSGICAYMVRTHMSLLAK